LQTCSIFSIDPALQARLTGAMAIGLATLRATPCDHYAFRQEGLDWQVWIQRGDKPTAPAIRAHDHR
jgi:hypothetical protein